jgi:hypothetical protein
MKLEVGKTYVLFNGEVRKCTRFSEATDDDIFFSQYGRFVLGVMYYHEDGTFADGCPNGLDVSHEYKEETTVEYKTFGEMTDEEKGALLLAQYEGKTIEFLSKTINNWVSTSPPEIFMISYKYRVRLGPISSYESKSIYSGNGCYTIGYATVDGEPDCSTIKMTKRASI